MAQVFPRTANEFARASLVVGGVVAAPGLRSLLSNTSPPLEPVRASWRSGTSIEWKKVHDLPDFVYFNHSAHVNKGVGCTTCHGPVDKMAYVWQEKSLLMEWCLDCHRQPEKYLRPRSEVYSVAWRF